MTWIIATLSLIEQKMCADDRKVWSRDLEKNKQPATLQNLMTWMTVEMKSRMRATAPLRTTSSAHHAVHHLTKTGEDGNKSIRCWLCKSATHWPDQCQQFAALSQDERLKAAKENHACFSCLKRAGREHRISNCSRRKQCTEVVENGTQCKYYHHPLLHRRADLKVSISSVADSQDALLPVISADIGGQ